MNNKNIIYSFYEPPLNWGEDYGKITLPTIESYAKKVGADFEIITPQDFPPLFKDIKEEYKNYEVSGVKQEDYIHYWCCSTSRLFLHKRFLESSYDRMLIIDADVYFPENSINIFAHPDFAQGWCMQALDGSYFASIKHDVELVFGTKVDKAVYGPFCLSDRPASQLLVKNFPSDEDFRKAISYVKYSNEERDSYNPNWVMKNPEAPRMFMVHDEHLYAYILNKANLNFTPIRLGSREVTTIQNRRIICGTSDEILPSLCYHFAGPEKIKLQDASFLKELETLNPPL